MSLYEVLDNKRRSRTAFENGDEFKYFIENRHNLKMFPRFESLYDSEENEFNVMRTNILLQGYQNKETIESEIANIASHGEVEHASFVIALKERIVDLPHYTENGVKIYIPFFSRALNEIYINEPEKLLKEPYSELKDAFEDASIDPFDTYGPELFNSYFTKLIKIKQQGKETAFFHYDTNTVYFVTDQGRLDNKLVLFDKYMKHPSFSHMIERITPVIDAYFANDRSAMVNALKDNQLISETIFEQIRIKK